MDFIAKGVYEYVGEDNYSFKSSVGNYHVIFDKKICFSFDGTLDGLSECCKKELKENFVKNIHFETTVSKEKVIFVSGSDRITFTQLFKAAQFEF